MNEAVVSGLENAWAHFLDSAERVAVLAGEGENFSVGLDLMNPPTDFWRSLPGIGFEIPKPIVAAVSGWCVGGAVTLVQMSDLCVAAGNTKFLYPEVKVGITGGVIAG